MLRKGKQEQAIKYRERAWTPFKSVESLDIKKSHSKKNKNSQKGIEYFDAKEVTKINNSNITKLSLRRSFSLDNSSNKSDSAEEDEDIILYPSTYRDEVKEKNEKQTSLVNVTIISSSSDELNNDASKTKIKRFKKKPKSKKLKQSAGKIIYLDPNHETNEGTNDNDINNEGWNEEFPWETEKFDKEEERLKSSSKYGLILNEWQLLNLIYMCRDINAHLTLVLVDMRPYKEWEKVKIDASIHWSELLDSIEDCKHTDCDDKCKDHIFPPLVPAENDSLVVVSIRLTEDNNLEESDFRSQYHVVNRAISNCGAIANYTFLWEDSVVKTTYLSSYSLHSQVSLAELCLTGYLNGLVILKESTGLRNQLSHFKPNIILIASTTGSTNTQDQKLICSACRQYTVLPDDLSVDLSSKKIRTILNQLVTPIIVDCDNNTELGHTLLLLLLMYVRHWSVQEALTYARYVRGCRAPPIYLTTKIKKLLTGFEKLFFDKRISSGSKKKLNSTNNNVPYDFCFYF